MISLEYVAAGLDVVILAPGLPLGLESFLGLPDAFLLILEKKTCDELSLLFT